jgi:hypothetical protein
VDAQPPASINRPPDARHVEAANRDPPLATLAKHNPRAAHVTGVAH